MSIKVYEAYRIPENRLNDFIHFIDKVCLNNIKEEIIKLYNNIVDESVEEYKNKHSYLKDYSDKEVKFELMVDMIRKDMESDMRGMCDMTSGVDMWLVGDKFYIVPYGEKWVYKDIEYPDFVEDYSYWDNTDRPEDISRIEWKDRRSKWKYILNIIGDRDRLRHEIFDLDMERWYEVRTELRKELL